MVQFCSLHSEVFPSALHRYILSNYVLTHCLPGASHIGGVRVTGRLNSVTEI